LILPTESILAFFPPQEHYEENECRAIANKGEGEAIQLAHDTFSDGELGAPNQNSEKRRREAGQWIMR
jgi:hypothetical protein